MQFPTTAKAEPGPKLKFCRACGRTHPVADFYSDRSRTDGLTAYCRKGDNARRVQRARLAREKARAAQFTKECHATN